MPGENEHSVMMQIQQEVSSVQGQINQVTAELKRIGKDPRFARRKKELELQLNKLQKALHRKFNS
jgi:chaperonin cofactor prefoldin